MPNLALRKCP